MTIERFIDQYIYSNASLLVSELAQDEKYIDELSPVLVSYSEEEGYEDEPIEALEHYIVSDWLANRLEEKGEMIIKDFLGLTIWGRTTSGQSVKMDGVIEQIYSEYI